MGFMLASKLSQVSSIPGPSTAIAESNVPASSSICVTSSSLPSAVTMQLHGQIWQDPQIGQGHGADISSVTTWPGGQA